MTILVTSVGNAWFLVRRLADGTLLPFGDPIASLAAAVRAAERMNAERAA